MSDEKAELLRRLHSPNAETREHATSQLWQLWFGAAGPEAEQILLHAERLVEAKEYNQAEAALTRLIEHYPDFAEAWNRRATMRYLIGDYEASLGDCLEVVQREPAHFGAMHGMGLCLIALHRYSEAAKAFRRALEIQPFAQANQDLLARCLEKLN